MYLVLDAVCKYNIRISVWLTEHCRHLMRFISGYKSVQIQRIFWMLLFNAASLHIATCSNDTLKNKGWQIQVMVSWFTIVNSGQIFNSFNTGFPPNISYFLT